MPKRRDRPTIASMRCTTRCIAEDVLAFAYVRCRANGGAAGVDGQTFDGHRGVRAGRSGWTNWRKN